MQPDTYEEISRKLYSKNVDLVNANKTLELLQKLYEIMITCYSIESVSQRFLDIIIQALGFTDGVVAARYENNPHLRVVALSQTQINKTVLELVNTSTVELTFDLNLKGNVLASAYLSGKIQITDSIVPLWAPYLKDQGAFGISSVVGKVLVLVYPIIFGDKTLGSFALVSNPAMQSLTEFEKKALDRLATVFGIAIDRVRINSELHAAERRELAKTKELLKLKDEFVFIATHDLRTPVTAISGFTQLLRKDTASLPQEAQEDLVAIQESSDRLEQLINDLLQVARSDSGTIVIDVKKVDVVELLQQVIQEITLSAQKKGITITTQLDQTNRFVLADKDKLLEVIENLLSNAVKYNKTNGSITVTSLVHDQNLAVSVADTGVGIAQDQQQRVFQKFFRARQKGTEVVGGTGLGLFVARMLMEKMGGTIAFTSTEGKGSTFTFRLLIAS